MGETEWSLGVEAARLDLPFDAYVFAALLTAEGDSQVTALAQAFPGLYGEFEERRRMPASRRRLGTPLSRAETGGRHRAGHDPGQGGNAGDPADGVAAPGTPPVSLRQAVTEWAGGYWANLPAAARDAIAAEYPALFPPPGRGADHPLWADPPRDLSEAEQARWREARAGELRSMSQACFNDVCELCESDSCGHSCHAEPGTVRRARAEAGCDPDTCRHPFGSHGPRCAASQPGDPLLLEGLAASIASDERAARPSIPPGSMPTLEDGTPDLGRLVVTPCPSRDLHAAHEHAGGQWWCEGIQFPAGGRAWAADDPANLSYHDRPGQ